MHPIKIPLPVNRSVNMDDEIVTYRPPDGGPEVFGIAHFQEEIDLDGVEAEYLQETLKVVAPIVENDEYRVLAESVHLNQALRGKTILSLNRAAQVTGYSRRHFLRLVEQEQVRTFEIGRKRFILAATLDEWTRQRGLTGQCVRNLAAT
jgi:predicted HTH domain antitoxin